MHIILTHEQADFDALASLLGAYLLDDSAMPVLPRRMNRNVRAYLTLYGMDLPFVDPRDIPVGPIQHVTLVDTQSMVSVRGMSSETQVRVLDHHPLREHLPPLWTVIHEDVGATTTLIVNHMRQGDILLNTVQATLLLLGIYEDTGSLTYERTTPDDLHAAAYLLEQGASLAIATDFLNHPLSPGQQLLYDQLRAESESLNIHGHTIIVAWTDAQGMDEELSTVAHKLRDLLDPDALFVLVTTRGGVQMIARSNSEHIDVAEILSGFGGGGHERAAAGLVRNRELQDVRTELKRALPDFVQPAITVAEIMSRGPQVLSMDTPVEDAALRMRRFGYEGYPVVKNGKVVGLLTRRAVDRALAHNYHMPASSLMDAGEYTVHPGDSILHLQRLMTDSGWGQIPVVEPESGVLIGIVTRTDLLKTLAPEPRLPRRMNLATRLEAVLQPEHLTLLQTIAGAASDQHVALYIVGGFVRDLLLEHPSQDFDLVVEGDAIALADSLKHQYGGYTTSHSRFGTAKWYLPDDSSPNAKLPQVPGLAFVDLVSARTEFYTYPSALPTVERGSIKLDLHRRDFTINTLALRLDGHHYGELHDYWGGLNDLNQGLVRVLHSLSFIDDPTRMLRAARFEQRFRFRIEERTLQLMQEALPLLEKVSGDRIRHELNHILADNQVSLIMRRLAELNLLATIHPALTWDAWLVERFSVDRLALPPAEWGITGYKTELELERDLGYSLWLVRLPVVTARQVCARLKASADLTQVIVSACNLWHNLPELANAPPSVIVSHLDGLPPLARYTVYLATTEPDHSNLIKRYVEQWQKISPTIDGHDLRRMGLPPSPAYDTVLTALRAAWLDGQVSTPEAEGELLQKLLNDSQVRAQLNRAPRQAT
ncbi:MAG: tRNA nucleotidyltransferase [Chloroflexi bacterium]|nr:tRNA nucleotidyltransferase [Chloroflexota bacterium]